MVAVSEEHHVGQAQRAARAVAGAAGLSRVAAYDIATAVSELASNLVFHARGGGTIALRAVTRDGRAGVEVVAEDRGPGIADLTLAMRDGFSTNGGLGGGLPGAQRLLDELEVTSSAHRGTRVVGRKWAASRQRAGAPVGGGSVRAAGRGGG